MKTVLVFLLFVAFGFAAKSQSNQPKLTYKQKHWLDSLLSHRKQPTVAIIPGPQLVYNTPLDLLPSGGKNVGLSGEDTIYQMKTDNMLLLKPNRNATYASNTTAGKVFTIPPAKKP